MSFERSLLPTNYPRYGRAVDETGARLADVPVPIGDMWNPWRTPEAVLPFLAWALSVDVWDEEWETAKKRSVVANSLWLHMHKGTLGGIKDHVALVGSTIVSAVTPPAAAYLSPDITAEERNAFLADLPQLRLYDQWQGEAASDATFWDDFSGEFDTDSAGHHLWFELDDTSGARTGEFAELYDRGVVKVLDRNAVRIDGNHYQVTLNGAGGYGVFSGGAWPSVGLPHASFFNDPDEFLLESTAASRYFTFTLQQSTGSNRLLYSFAIHASGSPVNTEPDFVAEHGHDFAGVFCDLPIGEAGTAGAAYFTPNLAGTRLFRVVYFFREERASIDTRALSFLDDARFGIDDYTAELSAVIPGKRPVWIADDFIDGYLYDDEPVALWKTCDAIVAAKSERDKILVRTSLFKSLTIGQRLLVGTPLILGEFSSTWR